MIGHAGELLQLVRSTEKPADSIIDMFFRSRKYLGSHDRRFIAESTYGTLRHLRKCESLLRQALGGHADSMIPDDGFLFLVVTYLLAIEPRTPIEVADLEPAVKSGKLKPQLGSLLRSLSAPQNVRPVDPVARIGEEYSYPDWMVQRFLDQYGEQETLLLCQSLNGQAPLTLRANTLKSTVEECQEALKNEDVVTERTKLSPFGLVVPKRINIFQLQAFRDGLFEVQDEGSQLLPYLLDPKPTAKVLDACAGAGGKTLELSAIMKNRGEIVAADVHSYRLEQLRKRTQRAGVSNVRIRQVQDITDLGEQYADYFDVVLIDAPCSGIGTLRRNPGMKWMVTEETIREVSEKQLHILEACVPFVKSGGKIAYATCTLFREENESVVENFLSAHKEFALDDPPLDRAKFDFSLYSVGKYIKFSPHRDGTDGFFIAVMKKHPQRAETDSHRPLDSK
ncbi:MAG: methyltransferase domain-containing protein [Ignavibacteriales bacterium]|nr:methyltransferase domain-containing protein [Ignavibacteriales bacterium]